MAAKKKLTMQQQKFADNILRHPKGSGDEWSQGKCYMDAYPNVRKVGTADAAASRLLKDVKVQEYIQKRRANVEKKTEITMERIEREYEKIAFLDPRKFYNPDGTLKEIHELDADTAAALAGMDVSRFKLGKDADWETIKKIKFVDKKGALDSLTKIKGGFKRDNEQKRVNLGDVITALPDKFRDGVCEALSKLVSD